MRKNFIRSLAVLLVIFSLMGTTAFAESAAVIGNAVNLRSGPGLDYQVLDTLSGGTVVEVTNRSGNWCAVSYNGTDGYMATGYLSTLSAYDQTATVSSVNSYDSSYESSEGVGVIEFEGTKSGAKASVPAAAAQAQAASGESAVVTLPASTGSASASSASAAVTLPAASGSAADGNEGSSVIVLPDGRISSGSGTKPAAQTAAAVSSVGRSGTVNSDFVCLRSGPSGSHSIISSYNKGKELVVSGEPVNGWTPCVIDNRSGYIYTPYITLREQQSAPAAVQTAAGSASAGSAATATALSSVQSANAAAAGNAYITGNNVRLRSGPSMSSAILGELFYGNAVTVTGSSGSWTAVTVNGQAGYVYSQYVRSSTQSAAAASGSTQTAQSAPVVTVPSTGSATGKQIAEYALQFVGYRYQWGGMSPETGFDCSGFVKYVYSKFGYTLNRVAGDQASNGVPVDIGALQPGDVLCFYSSANYIGHTGIYIGNNKFVHASTSTTGVIISELSGYYTDRGYVARRIV